MKYRCSIKSKKLPPAPEPTRPVRINEKPDIVGWRGAEDDDHRMKARENSIRNNPRAWSAEETELIKKMTRAGANVEEIALELPRRTEAAVDAKLRKLRKNGEI